MRFTNKKTTIMIATAVAVSGLVAAGGPAQARTAVKAKEKTTQSKPAPASARPDRAASLRTTATSQKALSTVQARVRTYVARHGTKYTFGTYTDATTGRIVMDTNAPATVVSKLTKATTNARVIAGFKVKVNKKRISDQFNRRDDSPAFYGGGGLLASNALCSAGYTVTNASGNRWMVSAGHCYAIGTRVNTESNARYFGTVTNRALASLGQTGLDMELLNGGSYAGRIFTGGVTSTSSIPVVGAGSASVGYTNYCHSGRTTGEQCGHTAISTTAQVCTATGCKTNVIAFRGGVLSQGGDSGSPFYAKDSRGAWIRGHVIAGNGTTSYAETWNKVAAGTASASSPADTQHPPPAHAPQDAQGHTGPGRPGCSAHLDRPRPPERVGSRAVLVVQHHPHVQVVVARGQRRHRHTGPGLPSPRAPRPPPRSGAGSVRRRPGRPAA